MKKWMLMVVTALMAVGTEAAHVYFPWKNGKLKVSSNHRYLVHENGTPFFWLGNTAWLISERLNRDEVEYYLNKEREAGYNVEQIQVLNAIPTFDVYGHQANDESFDFDQFSQSGEYGYWEHLDYIVNMAQQNGIYIAMDCIWGSQISRMTPEKAAKYGKFLGERYKDCPNIIWMIGGDIMGDKETESWDALARAIKQADPNHLMTFHPRGRTTSAWWYNDREWLDFNMFQSGHRRYGQRNGDGDYTIKDNTEEDNWRYVEMSRENTHAYSPKNRKEGQESQSKKQENGNNELGDGEFMPVERVVTGPLKPVIDGEPSYEDIPQGLHDLSAPRWQDYDVRRYAYWAVFGGCFGHTYGHNSIMQFMRPGLLASFGAEKPWWDALKDPGYGQMKYLKWLMLSLPFTDGENDQSIIAGKNGERYDRIIATRGKDYLLVYNYSGKPMQIDLRKISGAKKNVWVMDPSDGSLTYLGEYRNEICLFDICIGTQTVNDRVLIAIDTNKDYLKKDATQLEEKW